MVIRSAVERLWPTAMLLLAAAAATLTMTACARRLQPLRLPEMAAAPPLRPR